MTLKEAIDHFIANVPKDINNESDKLNKALFEIQYCLGQDDGGPASAFIDEDWLKRWSKYKTDDEARELVLEYIKFELSYL